MRFSQKYEPELFRILTDYDTEAVLELPMQLVEITGIGLPTMDVVTSRTPTQHGDTVLGQYAQPRVFTVGLVLKNLWGPVDDRTKWGARQKLLAVANPALGTLTFEIAMTNGDVYQLKKVTLDTGFELGLDTAGNPRYQNIALRFVAHDPIWWGKEYETTYNPTDHNSSVLPVWLYVTPVETYGTWFSYPEIDLTGPLYNPLLIIRKMNPVTLGLETVASIWIQKNIAPGEHVYIKTAMGERGAEDDNGDNVTLVDGSIFQDFQLSPSPIRLLHEEQNEPSWYQNFFELYSSIVVTADSRITFRYYDRFTAI